MIESLEKIESYLNSEEGENYIEEWSKQMIVYNKHRDRWIQKIESKYGKNIDNLIEKLTSKYYSEEYIDREYKIGVQPRDPLLWLLFEYAEKNCEICENEKYLNQFTGEAYYIGSYVIQVMHGQGSIIKIEKVL